MNPEPVNTNLIAQLVITVLGAILSIVVPVATVWLRGLVEANLAGAKAKLTSQQYDTARGILADLVRSAKARGLNGQLENIGQNLHDWVITRAEQEVKRLGLPFDVAQLDDMLEAAYIDMVYPTLELVEGELNQATPVDQAPIDITPDPKSDMSATKKMPRQRYVPPAV